MTKKERRTEKLCVVLLILKVCFHMSSRKQIKELIKSVSQSLKKFTEARLTPHNTNEITVLKEHVRIFAFRCGYRSTVKIGSKREKTIAENLKETERVRLDKSPALFFLRNSFFCSADFRDCDNKETDDCFFRCSVAPAEKAKNNIWR